MAQTGKKKTASAGKASASGRRQTTGKRTGSTGSSAGRSAAAGKTSGSRSRSASGTGRKRASSAGSGSAARSVRRDSARSRAQMANEKQQRDIRRDITLIVVVIVTCFLYASLAGMCGSVGAVLSRILCGLFGRGAWGLPLWLGCFCLYLRNGTGGRRMPQRLIGGLILILLLGSVSHLRLHWAHALSLDAPYNLRQVFAVCAERLAGGGITGGLLARFLYRAFGTAGSILMDTGLIVIGLILLLQVSPGQLLESLTARLNDHDGPSLSERRAEYRRRREEELEAREEARLERQTERILAKEERELEREQEAARKRAQNIDEDMSSGGKRRRRTDARTGTIPDLDNTLLGYRERRAGSSARTQKGNNGDGTREWIRDGRVRDVHEIVLLDQETSDSRSAGMDPAERRRTRPAGQPEPDGTTYRRPGSFAEDPAEGPGAAAHTPDAAAAPAFVLASGTSVRRRADRLTTLAEREAGNAAAEGTVTPADADMSYSDESGADRRSSGSSINGIRSAAEADGFWEENPESGEKPASGGYPAEEDGRGGNAAMAAGARRGTAEDRAGSGSSHQVKGPAAGDPAAGEPSEEELSEIAVHRESGDGRGQRRGAGRTAAAKTGGSYTHPPYDLLVRGTGGRSEETERELQKTAYLLQETLRTFGVQVTITDISQGPSVTRYELKPDQGVKVSRIVNLSDDIKLRLAATDIRIEAPIPGKSAIGIEVPNKHETTVHLRELLETRKFKKFEGRLPFAVGKDIAGKTVIADIARMPHVLIAGATGSGKSVCINTIILSILYRTSPRDVRLLMIDPKVVELSVYKGIPHLIIPVVTDARKASAALNWAVAEMEKRYKLFAAAGVRDLNGYNALAETWLDENGEPEREPLPRLVIIVDELADLMMVAKSEVESAICRLAQLARAAGIHLIIATQRPSVDVITGLIKANMPSRIAFAVSSQVDSRTILDMAGAEKLIGRGDMLFYPQNYQKPARIQGAFVSDEEVTEVVKYIREHNESDTHDEKIDAEIDNIAVNGLPDPGAGDVKADPARDEHFVEAGRFIIEKNKASIGLLQRVFKIGFNRAARIMDQLAEAGVVSEESSTRARQVLMTLPEFEAYLENES